MAGFVMDDEDDGDEGTDAAVPGLVGDPSLVAASGTPDRVQVPSIHASPKSPTPPFVAQNGSLLNPASGIAPGSDPFAAPQGGAPVTPVVGDPPTPFIDVTNTSPDGEGQVPAVSVRSPTTEADRSSIMATKARLPHDRVGMLEDRIKEDPRGDLDAWLGLIGEHRRRNKISEARAVYERFFKVFPMAVGWPWRILPLSFG